jgi:putative ABC transport system permease protein
MSRRSENSAWTTWLPTLQLALRNLMLHKLRSLLTMLGTVLGVASVIAMLAIGEGSKREAIEQIRKLGANNVIIRTVKPKTEAMAPATTEQQPQQQQQARIIEYGLTYKDFEILTSTLPNVQIGVPISLIRKNAARGSRRIPNARIVGTTPRMLHVKNLSLRRGSRFIGEPDLHWTSNVAVLGSGAAKKLFGYEDPRGKSVLLGTGAYRVVGVLKQQSTGNAMPGAVGQDNFNNDIYIPLTAAQRRVGELQRVGTMEFEKIQLSEITLTVNDERFVEATAAMARKLLETTHPGGDDFEIQVPLELLQQAERERQIWNLVLGSIAGISLLVGGIGIMNIMLATVTERTREIGIRRALGARRNDITIQFLVESTALSTIGGLLGVFVGVGIPIVVTIASDIPTNISWGSIVLAFGISVGIGIVFGVYPARRAAYMDPIEALRHD